MNMYGLGAYDSILDTVLRVSLTYILRLLHIPFEYHDTCSSTFLDTSLRFILHRFAALSLTHEHPYLVLPTAGSMLRTIVESAATAKPSPLHYKHSH